MSDPVEIRHLRYFLAVAEAENFTRAAQRLRISQPSISQAIAQLERELGTTLFGRAGKRAQLTEAGVAFRHSAEVVLRKLDAARASVRQAGGRTTGHVDLGVIPALSAGWLPWVLERVALEHPGITVRVQQRASSDVETALEAGRVDLGLGLMTRTSPRIRYEHLASEPFCLLVSQKSPFAKRRRINPSELDGVPMALLPQTFDMRRYADELLRRFKVRLNAVYEIDNIDSVLMTVATKASVSAVFPAVVLHGREGLGLRAIPLGGKTRRLEFGILWPLAESPSPAALAVAASARALFKE